MKEPIVLSLEKARQMARQVLDAANATRPGKLFVGCALRIPGEPGGALLTPEWAEKVLA